MKRVMTRVAIGGALLSLLPLAAFAGEHDHHNMAGMKAATSPAGALSEGTVKKIDKAAGKVTLAHGPIVNLGMGGMTMSFKVKDPKALAGLKEGAKVRFRAEDVGGVLTVVRIQAAD